MIESIEILTTLKAGKNIWVKGSVVRAPLHPDLLLELRLQTGNVKVLSESTAFIHELPKEESPQTSVSIIMTDNDFKEVTSPKAPREGDAKEEKKIESKKKIPKIARR